MIRHEMVKVNGVRLHVARAGQGRPLVLLHGWPEFWFTWHPIIDRLQDRFELIAPDLRGFGDSDKPTEDLGPADLAADIEALIALLPDAPVGLIAHDVGASVAQVIARRSPDLVAGLFMFNFMYPGIGQRFYTPGHLSYVWHTMFNQSAIAAPLLRGSPDGVRLFVTHFLNLWAYNKEAFDQATVDAYVANMEKPGNLEGGFSYYRGVAALRAREHQGNENVEPITVPTAVRWTERDVALDVEWTDRLDEFFTDLDFATFPGAGHFPQRERPDEAAQEIARFFDRVERQGWSR